MTPNLCPVSACPLTSRWHVHCTISTSNLTSPKKNSKISSPAKKTQKCSLFLMLLQVWPQIAVLFLLLWPYILSTNPVQSITLSPIFYPQISKNQVSLQAVPSPFPTPNTIYPQGPKQSLTSWQSILGSSWLTRKCFYTVQFSPYHNLPCIIYWSDFFPRWKMSKGKRVCPLHLSTSTFQVCFSPGNTNATLGETIHDAGMSQAIQHI